MPPARPAPAVHRRERQARAQTRPRWVAPRRPGGRVRWDRVGRLGLLVVLAVVAGLYVQHTLSYFSTRSQADQQLAIVHQLTRENARLVQQEKSLKDPAMIQQLARTLGMVKAGERPYVITGLPRR